MEDRQCVQQAVVSRESPGLHKGLRVPEEIGMRQHDAFRHAGGSRRVQQRRQIVGLTHDSGEFRGRGLRNVRLENRCHRHRA